MRARSLPSGCRTASQQYHHGGQRLTQQGSRWLQVTHALVWPGPTPLQPRTLSLSFLVLHRTVRGVLERPSSSNPPSCLALGVTSWLFACRPSRGEDGSSASFSLVSSALRTLLFPFTPRLSHATVRRPRQMTADVRPEAVFALSDGRPCAYTAVFAPRYIPPFLVVSAAISNVSPPHQVRLACSPIVALQPQAPTGSRTHHPGKGHHPRLPGRPCTKISSRIHRPSRIGFSAESCAQCPPAIHSFPPALQRALR